MPSFIYVKEADLGPLGDAVGSWKALTAKYEGLGDEFSRRVTQHLKGHWEGDAADSAFATMKKAEQQYKDAATEAGRISKLLADAHTEFAKYQKQLLARVDEATADSFHISDKGVITDVDSRWNSPTASNDPNFAPEREKKLKALTSHIKQILAQATAADEAASAALQRDANGSSDDFNRSVYTTLDAVEADEASQLMKKKGRLTDAEVTKLNNLLAANKNDPEFSRRFAVETGADNILSKYNQLINPPAGTQLSKADLAELKSLQKNLGTTMATATTSDDNAKPPDPAITKFQNDLVEAGQHTFNANPTETPYGLNGFQLTSSLMSNGKWDTDFLQGYGDDLIAAEKNGSNAGENPNVYWSGNATRSLGSTHMGALDPMAGFMDALGHNPEASTEFLGSESTINGEKVDHLDYLLKDRHWPEGADYTGDAKNLTGYNNLGHALESATTGHAYGSAPEAGAPHSEAEAAVMSRLVSAVSEDDSTVHNGMADSLGRISAEYMPDIHHALSGGQANGASDGSLDSLYPRGENSPLLFPSGHPERDMTRFLYAVGQDPDGYAAINYGQTQYTSELINYHFSHPDATSGSTGQTLEEVTRRGSEIESIIGHARKDSDVQDAADGDAKFNSALTSGTDWAKTITGIGVGVGTATITSPVGGAFVGAAAGDISGRVIDGITSGLVRDSTGDAVYAAAGNIEDNKRSVQAVTEHAANLANNENPSGLTSNDIQDAVRRGTEDGNGLGNDTLEDNVYDHADS